MKPVRAPLLLAASCLGAGGCTLVFEPEDPACRELGAFGDAKEVLSGDMNFDDPALRADLREIVFDGGAELHSARRGDPGQSWGGPVPLNFDLDLQSDPFLSADRQRLWLCGRDGTATRNVFLAERADDSEEWEPPTEELTMEGLHACPGWVNEEATLMLLAAGNANAEELYVSRRASAESDWDEPEKLSGEELPQSPVESPHYLECAGEIWFGGPDGIYAAGWHPEEDSMRDVRPVEDPGAPDGDVSDPWLSADGARLFFTLRPTESAASIYKARRSR